MCGELLLFSSLLGCHAETCQRLLSDALTSGPKNLRIADSYQLVQLRIVKLLSTLAGGFAFNVNKATIL